MPIDYSITYIYGLSLIPLSLGIAHTLGLYGQRHFKSGIKPLRSFASGFSIAYVFLILIPELLVRRFQLSIEAMVFVLLGFSVVHTVHKYVFTAKTKKLRALLIDEIHLLTAASYSFLISFSLVELAKINFSRGLLTAVVILLHTLLSEISNVDAIDSYIDHIKAPILVGMTFLGGYLAIFNAANPLTTAILFAISGGAMIYISIREEMPADTDAKPWAFLVGILVFLLLDNFILSL